MLKTKLSQTIYKLNRSQHMLNFLIYLEIYLASKAEKDKVECTNHLSMQKPKLSQTILSSKKD